jgi:C4-dicarboxylate transporter, DctM subunit
VAEGMIVALMVAAFLTLSFVGVPVAVALIGGAILGAMLADLPLSALVTRLYDGVNSIPLLAIPFFILVAELLNSSGVAARIIRFTQTLVGHFRSGLAQINVMFSLVFAGNSGSSTADVAANARLLLPAMKAEGYKPAQSAALIAAASTIANLIPPSILAIVYGAAGSVSISALFIGGLLPGLFVGIGLMVFTRLFIHGPKHKRATIPEVLEATQRSALPLLIPVIILGGILSGYFTPTEAGMVAVVYTIVVVFPLIARSHFKLLPRDFIDAAVLYSTPLIAVAAASAFAWVLAVLKAPQAVTDLLANVGGDNPTLLLFLSVLVVIGLGQFIDPVPAVVILMPLLNQMLVLGGINSLHMGIVVVVALSFGLVTPPYGLSLLMATNFAGVPFTAGLKEALPLYVVFVVTLGVLIGSEDVALWLPRTLTPALVPGG